MVRSRPFLCVWDQSGLRPGGAGGRSSQMVPSHPTPGEVGALEVASLV